VKILVTGFGPFLDVADNPAARLAREVEGLRDAGLDVVGRELPVSYARAPELTARWAREVAADFVLGIGVARGRKEPQVERVARRAADASLADVDGVRLRELASDGPEQIVCADAESVARALGVALSDDAGAYVCNAWLYAVLRAGLRAAFLHVPPRGIAAGRLAEGLRALACGGLTSAPASSV
jgi:pyroglutamyl-peptidase